MATLLLTAAGSLLGPVGGALGALVGRQIDSAVFGSRKIEGPRLKELAVTTVLTVLSRLEKKGLVERERGTRPHRYQAVSSRADHTAELMHEVLGSAPDREAVLARFIGSVSEGEAETLRKLLGHL